MSYVIILAAAALVSTGALFLYRRQAGERPQQVATGTVSCKKCGARIFVSNPAKLQHEFSVKCVACDSRKLYKLVDLAR
jgi:DNA-directed RNA polymerase subunit RPC12/RpoP